jgi:ABC-type sugar transport system permease subunit
MTPTPNTPAPVASGPKRLLRLWLGLLLVLPAALCCGTSLLAPTVQTFLLSLQKANGLGPASSVGFANYAQLAQLGPLGKALGFTLEMAIMRLLAVAVVPVLLALAASALNRWVRGGLRLLFTLPLALFAPTGLAVAWVLARTPGSNTLATAGGAQSTLLFIDFAQTLGLACALGLIVYLAAMRAQGPGRRRGPVVVIGVVSTLAAVASALQTFSSPYLITRGGPASATTTLMLLQYQVGFVNLQLGLAAALATLSLLLLAGLGVLAALLVVLSGVRLDHASDPGPEKPWLPAILAAGLVVVLGLVAFGVWLSGQGPLFQAAGRALTAEAPSAGSNTFSNSTVGPLVVLLLQLPLAYLAALGISALRPLGDKSEWLLLPFSPWLFVTVGPLSVAEFMSLRQAGQLNSVGALVPPILLSVPMLFVLVLFFRGRVRRWQAARAAGQSTLAAFFGQFVGPSLPLALLLGVIGMLASYQELLWPLLAASKPEFATGTTTLALQLGRLASNSGGLARTVMGTVLPGFIFGLIVLAVLQVAYVGRLVARTGPEEKL